MIPKTIWQTYEAEYYLLPSNIKDYVESWVKDYPDFEYKYMDSTQRENFILDNFGKEWYDIFISCPLNIMRSNLWRFMVLYVYGGIYFDLDTSPNYNINNWLKDEYDVILFADESEPELLFFIQVIASAPKNPIFKKLIDHLFIIFNSNEYKTITQYDKYFVFKYGGEISTIQGIKKAIDPSNNISYICKHNEYNNATNSNIYKFFCYSNDYDIFKGKAFTNIDGANNWKTGYTNWWEEAK